MTTHVRLGDALQAGCEVGGLPDDAALLRLPHSNEVAHDDQSGGNADAGLQRDRRTACGHRPDQLQACPHRPFGVVLMGLGITKIHEHTIAHVFRDKPVKAAHRVGDAPLISRNDLAQILRIHAGGKRRRADQVGEHHRDVPALGRVMRL
jgi:hypothetical protein